ncbi:MAG0110 family membrane protein [[Mycoplasma] collis]|uniref:MAG0110 family membrane protein n=1 Tax=[Mycoplasma] collis TaxID=2127 RepID=UPI00051BADB2|nr:Bax inhibitor-1 family protein [[Mycoplasma] collis]
MNSVNFWAKSFKQTFSKEEKLLKNRMLAYSLGWFSLGLTITFLFNFIILATSPIFNAYTSLIGRLFSSSITTIFFLIITFVFEIALLTYISRVRIRKKLINIILAYFAFILVHTFLIPMFIIFSYHYSLISENGLNFVTRLFIALLVPTISIAIFGFLGYFNVIDFSKLMPFAILGSIVIIIMALISYFISYNTIFTIISVISILIAWIYIGFGFQQISNQANFILQQDMSIEEKKRQMLKHSIYWGLWILMMFIKIFINMLRLTQKN